MPVYYPCPVCPQRFYEAVHRNAHVGTHIDAKSGVRMNSDPDSKYEVVLGRDLREGDIVRMYEKDHSQDTDFFVWERKHCGTLSMSALVTVNGQHALIDGDEADWSVEFDMHVEPTAGFCVLARGVASSSLPKHVFGR